MYLERAAFPLIGYGRSRIYKKEVKEIPLSKFSKRSNDYTIELVL